MKRRTSSVLFKLQRALYNVAEEKTVVYLLR